MGSREKPVLVCTGLEIAGTMVPAFELRAGDHIGVVIPVAFGEVWKTMARVLSGVGGGPGIRTQSGAGRVLGVLRSHWRSEGGAVTTLQYAVRRLGSKKRALHVINESGLQPNVTWDDLGMTQSLLFELSMAREEVVPFAVFTLSGLDPMGLARVGHVARQLAMVCPVIDLVATESRQWYADEASPNRWVECPATL